MLLFACAAGWATALLLRRVTPFQMKLAHVPVFFLWTISLACVFRRTLLLRPNVPMELGLAGVFAAAAEIIQRWLPPHVCDWMGFSASMAGVFLAGIFLVAVVRIGKRREGTTEPAGRKKEGGEGEANDGGRADGGANGGCR